jgi:hypothetical protein
MCVQGGQAQQDERSPEVLSPASNEARAASKRTNSPDSSFKMDFSSLLIAAFVSLAVAAPTPLPEESHSPVITSFARW